MSDASMPGGEPTAFICPWCSARYQGELENCPSCGAALTGDAAADSSLPGLTAIDAAAILRAKEPVKKPRSRLLAWISGDYPDETPSVSEAEALAPPDLEVRREILRLELEAEVANLQAEADAMKAEAVAEGRAFTMDAPPDPAADSEPTAGPAAEAASDATPDATDATPDTAPDAAAPDAAPPDAAPVDDGGRPA